MVFISPISTSIPSRASNCARPTPSVSAPQRTILGKPSSSAAFTNVCWFIASIATGYDGITEFVFRKAFSISTPESIRWATFSSRRLTVSFIFPGRAIFYTITATRAWYTATGSFTSESFRRTFCRRTFFIRTVTAIFPTITYEKPTYTCTRTSTLEIKKKIRFDIITFRVCFKYIKV